MPKSTYLPAAFAGVAAAALLLSAAVAHEFKAGTLVLDHPWARATVPAAKVGGGYLTIVNSGAEADRLVSVSVAPEVATRAEIHEMAVKDGVMTMRELSGGIEIPAGGTVTLQPGSGNGYHVMFTGLKAPLTEGQKFSGKLVFEKAGDVAVEFSVEGKGKAADPHAGHGG